MGSRKFRKSDIEKFMDTKRLGMLGSVETYWKPFLGPVRDYLGFGVVFG